MKPLNEIIPANPLDIAVESGDGTTETLALFKQLRQDPQYAAELDQAAANLATLQDLRRAAGMTQEDVAEKLEKKQETILAFERNPNPKLNSLADYISELGGQLVVLAVFDGKTEQLTFQPKI